MASSQELAAKVLIEFEEAEKPLKEVFQKVCKKHGIRDYQIMASIYHYAFETVKNIIAIDFLLERTLKGDVTLKKLPPIVRNILRIAVFELKFEKNPSPLVTDLAVKIVKRNVSRRAANFVNAVLHQIDKTDLNNLVKNTNWARKLSILTSHPEWFVRKLENIMGREETEKFLRANNELRVTWLRVNTLKISVEKAIRKLEKENILVEEDKDFPEVLKIVKAEKPVVTSSLHKRNEVFIQDKGSVAVVHALTPEPGDIILDACAAPGMKTTLIAQHMENKGKIFAVDISPRRIQLLEKMVKSAGVKIVYPILGDSAKLKIKNISKILIDAPCSSSGILRSNPDIKVTLTPKRIKRLSLFQKMILQNMLEVLEEGGTLIYATCSVLPEEGEEQIDAFFNKVKLETPKTLGTRGYSNFKCTTFVKRLFPHIHDTSGFFISKMLKN